MDIRAKLKQLEGTLAIRPRATQSPDAGKFDPIVERLHARVLKNPFGLCLYKQTEYDLSDHYGNRSISACLHFDSELFAYIAKDMNFKEFQTRNVLFIDTETTGLAGGTGTYVFMVGIGYFTDDKFVIGQYFMPDYGCEKSFLYEIQQKLSSCNGFVSYNGRAYDFSILRTRFILARMKSDLDKLHLDLLYSVRRLWKKSLPDCRLGSAERFLLQTTRVDDLSGDQIPGIYFNYLQTGQISGIEKIFSHNRLDILSLSGILAHCLQAFHPEEANSLASDSSGILNTLSSLKQWHKAAQMAEELSQSEPSLVMRLKQGEYYKKCLDWDNAVKIWQSIVAGDHFEPLAYIELAKYYEHQAKNYAKALEFVNRLLQTAKTLEELRDFNTFANLKEELAKRSARLSAKLSAAGTLLYEHQ